MNLISFVYLGCFAGLVLLVYCTSWHDRRQRKLRFLRKAEENWGAPSERDYTFEQMDKLTHYFYLKQHDEFVIDDITWNDLDMDRVFRQMNQTYSSIGEEYLYNLLRSPVFDQEELDRRNRFIEYFQREKEERMLLLEIFGNMGRTSHVSVIGYLTQFEELEEKSPLRYYLRQAALILSAVLLFFIPVPALVLVIGVLGYNVVSYYKEKRQIEPYLEAFSYISNVLDKVYLFERSQSEFLRGYINGMMEKVKVLKKFQRGRFWLKSGNDMSGGLMDIVMDYVRVLLHVDLLQFYKMLKELYLHREDLLELYERIGFLESMLAAASYRTMLPACAIPEFHDSGICAQDLYHPLIAEPVVNSIQADRGVLLTGSNASGKSTFLKTMAINCIFAQTINTAAAQSFSMPMGRVCSSMALQDHLEHAESYYIVEIKSLKRILDMQGEGPLICFVDEVLRGTNTVERIAASAEILNSLSATDTYCFAATHDIELTYLLEEQYDNYHFSEQIKDGEVLFNYKLQSGRAMSRNAIKLLEVIGYEPEIIERATDRARHFLTQNQWKM